MSKLSALNILKEKLGEDGVNALIKVIEEERERTRDDLFRLLEERFARRLAEEIGKLRSEMYELFARHSAEVDGKIEGLRSEMIEKIESLRSGMHDEIGKLRAEVHQEIAKVWNEIGKLRSEMTEKIENLRSEMHSMKADIIKWMFIFWVSQLLALSGIIFTILRFVR